MVATVTERHWQQRSSRAQFRPDSRMLHAPRWLTALRHDWPRASDTLVWRSTNRLCDIAKYPDLRLGVAGIPNISACYHWPIDLQRDLYLLCGLALRPSSSRDDRRQLIW